MPTVSQLTQGNYNSTDGNNQIADTHFLIGYNGNAAAGSERRYSIGDLKKYINHEQQVHGDGSGASTEGGQITLCAGSTSSGIESPAWNFDVISRNMSNNVAVNCDWLRLFANDASSFLQGTQEGRWYFATDSHVAENIHQEWNGAVTIGPRFLATIPAGQVTPQWRCTGFNGTSRTFIWIGPGNGIATADMVGMRVAIGNQRIQDHDRNTLGVITAVPNGDTITVNCDRNSGAVTVNTNWLICRSYGGLSVKGYATSDDVMIDNFKAEADSTWSLNNPASPNNRITIDPTGNGDFNSQVAGRHVLGKITTRELDVTVGDGPNTGRAEVNIIGRGTPIEQASARLYLGQSDSYGFGLLYNADDNPNEIGVPDDCIFFNRNNNADSVIFKWRYNDTDVRFRTRVRINDDTFTQPAFACDVNGDIRASGDIIAQSDERYKSDISPVTDSIDKIKQLSGVKYVKKQTGRADYGLVAQQVEQVLPELVYSHDSGTYDDERSVNYNGVIPVLIEALKAQQEQIEQLQQRVGE